MIRLEFGPRQFFVSVRIGFGVLIEVLVLPYLCVCIDVVEFLRLPLRLRWDRSGFW